MTAIHYYNMYKKKGSRYRQQNTNRNSKGQNPHTDKMLTTMSHAVAAPGVSKRVSTLCFVHDIIELIIKDKNLRETSSSDTDSEIEEVTESSIQTYVQDVLNASKTNDRLVSDADVSAVDEDVLDAVIYEDSEEEYCFEIQLSKIASLDTSDSFAMSDSNNGDHEHKEAEMKKQAIGASQSEKEEKHGGEKTKQAYNIGVEDEKEKFKDNFYDFSLDEIEMAKENSIETFHQEQQKFKTQAGCENSVISSTNKSVMCVPSRNCSQKRHATEEVNESLNADDNSIHSREHHEEETCIRLPPKNILRSSEGYGTDNNANGDLLFKIKSISYNEEITYHYFSHSVNDILEGELREGDEIIEINEQLTSKFRHKDVIDHFSRFLEETEEKLVITVRRKNELKLLLFTFELIEEEIEQDGPGETILRKTILRFKKEDKIDKIRYSKFQKWEIKLGAAVGDFLNITPHGICMDVIDSDKNNNFILIQNRFVTESLKYRYICSIKAKDSDRYLKCCNKKLKLEKMVPVDEICTKETLTPDERFFIYYESNNKTYFRSYVYSDYYLACSDNKLELRKLEKATYPWSESFAMNQKASDFEFKLIDLKEC